MIYVVSDIHGCMEKYEQMLVRINLRDEDTLYVLGDIVDRGEDGIKVLQDMMCRSNIIPIIGNHDYLAALVLKKLSVEITEENADNHLDAEFMEILSSWLADGGETTLTAFGKMAPDEKADVLDYLSEFLPYEELEVNGNRFVLVHAGLMNFSPERDLNDYEIDELIVDRVDYSKVYFKDRFLVTGHTPTICIDKECRGHIYKKNNHIAIDCGAVYGEKLGALCLDTLEEYYV